MKYLQNNICEFKCVGFDIDPNVKKNIVSISFFKMYNGGYKDFNLYINGFKKLYKYVMEDELNYTIRLFIDNTIYNDKDLFSQLNNLERVNIIIYNCPKYIEKSNSDYHIGLFGTFVRFFPIFDFPNNDAKIVQIMDMDDYKYFLTNKESIKQIGKNIDSIYLLKNGSIHKNLYTNEILINNVINPYVVATKYISFKSLDYNVLIDFFKEIDMEKNKDKLYTLYKHKNNKKMIENNGKFIYGIDEYFININLCNYIIKNKIPFGVKFTWVVNGNLYYYLRSININNKETKLLNILLDYIFKKTNIQYNKNMNIRQKYKLIDNILYNKKNDINKIMYYFYKSFLYLYKNNNYKFLYNKNLYNIIKDNNLFGFYDFECIKYYFTPKDIPLQIINKKVFNKDQIEKLKTFAKKYTDML
jgi:hypothetical protein